MRLAFRLFAFFTIIGLMSVVSWFSWDSSITISKVPWARLNNISLNNIIDRGPSLSIKKTVDKKKWIVVTSIQYPTEDVKNLASQSGWTVVVVADSKTPTDWSHPGVHFLSVEDQASFGSFAQLLPFKSYTRKNLGYLYAMMNGAEWIYDTDDDNKPYGLGLAQFDYEDTISGLRYTVNVTSRNISEQLFNPYQFFGFKKMWPRGFPLEYLRGHNNGKNRMISCRKMATAAVQQGIVHNDPDVDAIFRLLNADKESGLHVSFNKFVPPITLEEGTYSPWNSQNTLFHRRAFFTMYLPTSVAFRVTDIWRSYFAQKLLHLIGEQVAFYPVNAVQFRNAHDYLKDFSQETDVYEKSGKVVEFLDRWICPNKTTSDCTETLALAFQEEDFWGEEDYALVKAWVQALKDMNYKFPELKVNSKHGEYKVNATVGWWNCREANIDAGLGEYDPDKTEDISIAQRAVDSYTEILDWCGYGDGMNDTFLPLAEDFTQTLKQGTLEVRQNQVLILINNFPWSRAIGLLQRMYQPFFAMTIFCGTWQTERFQNESLGLLDSINYININQNEMQSGRYYHYCVSKVRDLRLQNVWGYWFVADDSIFNVWAPTPVEIPIQPLPLAYGSKMFWHEKYGQKFLDLLQTQFKEEKAIQRSWTEFQENLKAKNSSMNATDLMLSFTGKVCWDFFYLPTKSMDYFGNLIEVLVSSEMHVENAVTKIIHSVEFDNTRGFQSIWTWDRGTTLRPYNNSRLGLHPVKLSYMDQKMNRRLPFCSIVIKKFVREIFGQEISLNATATEEPVKKHE